MQMRKGNREKGYLEIASLHMAFEIKVALYRCISQGTGKESVAMAV